MEQRQVKAMLADEPKSPEAGGFAAGPAPVTTGVGRQNSCEAGKTVGRFAKQTPALLVAGEADWSARPLHRARRRIHRPTARRAALGPEDRTPANEVSGRGPLLAALADVYLTQYGPPCGGRKEDDG